MHDGLVLVPVFIDHDGREREYLREDLRMDSHGILEPQK